MILHLHPNSSNLVCFLDSDTFPFPPASPASSRPLDSAPPVIRWTPKSKTAFGYLESACLERARRRIQAALTILGVGPVHHMTVRGLLDL